jgi:acetyl esterase/lipase
MNRNAPTSPSAHSRRAVLGGAAGLAALGLAGRPGPIAAQEAASTPARNVVDTENGVVYGEADGQELILDIARPPARDDPRPAVILIHGGGWTEYLGSRLDMSMPALELAKAGYVAFNVEYRLLTSEPGVHMWPAQLDDVQRAVRWVRANAATYGVDPERIGSYGHSSGGHLAAMLGVRETRDNGDPDLAGFSSRVTCVADLAGDMDLTIPYPQEMDNQIAINLLGGTPAEAPEAYRDASPIAWVDEQTAPFLILHGTNDTINPVAHSRTMEAALHEAGIEVVYLEDPHADHFTWGSWFNSGPWTLTFFAQHLHPER